MVAYDNKKPAISNGFWPPMDFIGLCPGGDEGARTPDLGIANAALSQLSYIPSQIRYHASKGFGNIHDASVKSQALVVSIEPLKG